MASQVYFGNASKQTWIKAPASGMKASSSSLITEQQLLNGRTFVNRSRLLTAVLRCLGLVH